MNKEVAKFKVAHLYPPYQGKGKAKIVADSGDKFSCEESQLKQFREGEDVAIYYTEETFTSKKTGEVVAFKKFISKIQGAGEANGAQSAPKQYTKARMDPADARGAFVTVILQAFITAGKVALERNVIAKARQEIGAGYDLSTNPQWRSDLKDEIPEEAWAVKSENPAAGLEDTF